MGGIKTTVDACGYLGFFTPLISFLLGFITAVFSEPLRQWFFRPVLKLSFEKSEDFVSRTPMKNGGKEHEAYYIRIKVENIKRRLAKACRAYLINVEEQDESGQFKKSIYADNLSLAWSCQEPDEARKPIDLPNGVAQFVDVIATDSIFNNYFIQVQPFPYRYERLFDKKPKTFRLTIQVSGDGVEPETVQLVFTWKDKWNDFDVSRY